VKLRIHITPCCEGASERRSDFHAWMQTSHTALEHSLDETGETYLLDLDHLYIVLLTMRELGIPPTSFRVELAGMPRKTTTQALNRRVAAIEMAILTVSDLNGLGHFAAGSDLRVVVEALLLLLHITQQGLEAAPHV
jgi:hypothetical protein